MLAPMRTPVAVPRGRLRVVAALVPLVAVVGCAGLGQPAAYDQPGINGLVIPTPSPDPDDFVDAVDNPWLPLEPGTTRTYEVTRDGSPLGTVVADVRDDLVPVAGLDATAVEITTDLGGAATVETRLYAQDDDGNVWLVGVESDEDPSWRAGTDGAEAGLAMPAQPRLGDGWPAYVVPPLPEASRQVEDLSSEMVEMLDEADTSNRSVYEKGVGLAGFEDLGAGWTAALTADGPS